MSELPDHRPTERHETTGILLGGRRRCGRRRSRCSTTMHEHVLDLAKALSREDRLRIVGRLAEDMIERGEASGEPPRPRESLRGAWKDLGPSPSPEDFEEARREMAGRFAEEEVAG